MRSLMVIFVGSKMYSFRHNLALLRFCNTKLCRILFISSNAGVDSNKKNLLKVNVLYAENMNNPELTVSLQRSCLSSSLSLRAFNILCTSDGSFRSLLRDIADGVIEVTFFDDMRVFAFSDISVASLSGIEGGTLSCALE